MPAKDDISIPLTPGCYYHIFNRGNNTDRIFYNQDNYEYFLRKLALYMSGYFQFYCYCLLPNHFHLLIKVKKIDEIILQVKVDFPDTDFTNHPDLQSRLEHLTSEKFRRFFLSYAKSINKQQFRHGSLFQKYFRRKEVKSDDYFKGLVWYIHNNPVNHGIYDDFKIYKWSSYKSVISNKPSLFNRTELFEWFGGVEHFISFHESKNIAWDELSILLIED